MLFCGKCWKIGPEVGLTDNEFTSLYNRALFLISLRFPNGPTRKIPTCIWEVPRKISFLSGKMSNFRFPSDYHFDPLNAFWPICCSGWHQGLCYQRILLSSPLLKWAFPAPGSFFVALGGPSRSGNSSTVCANGLWEKAVLLGQEEMARVGLRFWGFGAGSESPAEGCDSLGSCRLRALP